MTVKRCCQWMLALYVGMLVYSFFNTMIPAAVFNNDGYKIDSLAQKWQSNQWIQTIYLSMLISLPMAQLWTTLASMMKDHFLLKRYMSTWCYMYWRFIINICYIKSVISLYTKKEVFLIFNITISVFLKNDPHLYNIRKKK